MSSRFNNLRSYRGRFFTAVTLSLVVIAALGASSGFAYITDDSVKAPAAYLTFDPPVKGGSYTDAIFGSAVKRLSDSMHTPRADMPGTTVNLISPEYSTMSPFNNDNSRLILAHMGY